ncbi:sigma-E processing peptidase SpoIIGA [Paenibacillus koleovorans]|uniref:sigma-E processing peptidase SpoIIGA n=1 Tax=Paenibacillus koleovorans TaxID=121608 RepID=UPI000FD93550|nr:sigma-E processing peptidase SpoIIGA [Paenibacillus koleovorans]
MVVYLDLIFLINLFVDGVILYMTAWTRKLPVKLWRLGLSAALGASYVLLMWIPSLSFMFTIAAKCLLSVVMLVLAFGFGSMQAFLRNIGTFYLINFAVAGGIFALYYFTQTSSEVMNGILVTRTGGIGYTMQIGFWFTAIGLTFMIWFYRTVFTSMRRRQAMTQYLAQVRIQIGEFESQCTGLLDTGNQLYDPLTRTPVMVLEADQWRELLPPEWMKRIRQSEVDQLIASIDEGEWEWQDRLRLVPYRGVNRGTQFMLAVKPDKVVVSYSDNEIVNSKVLVGLDGGKLSADGSYQAILHPTLVQMDV